MQHPAGSAFTTAPAPGYTTYIPTCFWQLGARPDTEKCPTNSSKDRRNTIHEQ